MTHYPERAGFVSHSATSRAAADAVEAGGKITREVLIYETLKGEPMTRWELCAHLDLAYETVNPRCSEMTTRGLLRPNGVTREGKHGLQTDVLEVCAPYTRKLKGEIVRRYHNMNAAVEIINSVVVRLSKNSTPTFDEEFALSQCRRFLRDIS